MPCKAGPSVVQLCIGTHSGHLTICSTHYPEQQQHFSKSLIGAAPKAVGSGGLRRQLRVGGQAVTSTTQGWAERGPALREKATVNFPSPPHPGWSPGNSVIPEEHCAAARDERPALLYIPLLP